MSSILQSMSASWRRPGRSRTAAAIVARTTDRAERVLSRGMRPRIRPCGISRTGRAEKALRTIRTVSAATLSLLMCAVALTTPAGAGEQDEPRASTKDCDPGQHSHGTVLARGGVVREPGLDQAHQDLPASARGKAGDGFEVTVPVYFHV